MPSEIPAALRQQATPQGGVVTRKQAAQAGLSAAQIAWLLNRGSWLPLYRGVYATFTGPVSNKARLWAAVLYAGEGAYLSHETAAEMNRLTDEKSPVIHVTVPISRCVIPQEGMVIHRSSERPMVWRLPGVPPHTIAPRTVIDLVQAAPDVDRVIAVVTGGLGRRLVTDGDLRAMAQACKKLRWRPQLEEIAGAADAGAHSPLEYRHDRDVQRAHGLPDPVKQARFRKPDGTWGYRDRWYPQFGGLVIELDGKRFHPQERREGDTERDNQAAVTGATLRYGWDAVTRRPCETAQQLAGALRHRGWTGALRPCSPACRATAPARRPPRSRGLGAAATAAPG